MQPLWFALRDRLDGSVNNDSAWVTATPFLEQLQTLTGQLPKDRPGEVSGFIHLDAARYLMVAVAPILKSDLSGSGVGYLLMARQVDHPLLETLSEQVQSTIRLLDPNALQGADYTAQVIHSPEHHHVAMFKTLSEQQMVGYLHLPVLSEHHFMLVEVEIDRSIIYQALSSIRFMFMLTLAGALLILALTYLAFHHLFTRPMVRLAGLFHHHDKESPPLWLSEIGRRDEIGVLVREVSSMVRRMESRTRELDHLNHKLQAENGLRRAAEEQLLRTNDELKVVSLTDGLTGIMNRRAFNEALPREWSLAQRMALPLSMLILDIDHFKRYNDSYGHPQGDVALQQLAQVLTEVSRASDLVARYGGEEFVVIMPSTNRRGAAAAAERIIAILAERAIEHSGSATGYLTVSIGAITSDSKAGDGDHELFLKRCDDALYQAKAAGRNGYLLYTDPTPDKQTFIQAN